MKNSEMILRRAKSEEAKICFQFIEDARAYQKSLGFEQWHAGYPTLCTIQEDIEAGNGFVFEKDGVPVGYCFISADGEPAYETIDGEWKTSQPYAVMHRMAFSDDTRGKGLSAKAFSLIKSECVKAGIGAIRVDTQKGNTVMQHILLREGFKYCGTITFDGGPKLAYEWDK